jgi:hypothetical protein
MGWWLVSLGCVAALLACGGQSTDENGSGGGAGESAGTGGSGARAGSTATGGNTPIGGSISFGGSWSLAGRDSMGGSAPTSGRAGDAPECQLPLQTGSCNAAFARYAFIPGLGHCQRFIYGGCGANANNFESLKACEAACGGSALGDCPDARPDQGEACQGATATCHYAANGCLCVLEEEFGHCRQIDPNCQYRERKAPPPDVPGCTGPDCPLPIVLPTPYTCECADAAWSCVP